MLLVAKITLFYSYILATLIFSQEKNGEIQDEGSGKQIGLTPLV
jgi:hypothetical protein